MSRKPAKGRGGFNRIRREQATAKAAKLAAATDILLIDDLRTLPNVTHVARSSQVGRHLLDKYRRKAIKELWLDHDLGPGDTIMPVIGMLERAAFDGKPFSIGTIYVHTDNPAGARTMMATLERWGYNVRRSSLRSIDSE